MKKTVLLLKMFRVSILLYLVCFVSCGGSKLEFESCNTANQIDAKKPVLKVYLENSGSMDGYMCDGSQLKDAVFSYVSDLSLCTDTVQLNYINNTVIPFHGSLEEYIHNLNPISFRKAGGNRSNSDLSKIFNTMLKEVSDTSVCILISDCILALPVSNSQKFLQTCQISIKNTINEARKHNPSLCIEVLKMMSDFSGKYFYQNNKVENLHNVKRPYYIWIFGNHNVLANLYKEVPISNLENHGLEYFVSFINKVDIPYEISNKATTSNIVIPQKGNYIATIRADFSALLQPESVILNPSNFSFNNKQIKIESILPISAKGSAYTHSITFVIPEGVKIAQEELSLYATPIPDWVISSNDDTDENIMNNLDKTTGIKYLINGVAESYKKENVLTSFIFKVNRK